MHAANHKGVTVSEVADWYEHTEIWDEVLLSFNYDPAKVRARHPGRYAKTTSFGEMRDPPTDGLRRRGTFARCEDVDSDEESV